MGGREGKRMVVMDEQVNKIWFVWVFEQRLALPALFGTGH